MKTLNSNVTIERHNRTSSCSRPEFQNKRKETRLATSQLQTTNQVKKENNKKKKRDERHQCGVHSSIFYTFGIQDISSSMVQLVIPIISAPNCEQWRLRTVACSLVTSSFVARLPEKTNVYGIVFSAWSLSQYLWSCIFSFHLISVWQFEEISSFTKPSNNCSSWSDQSSCLHVSILIASKPQ